ncbi:MAG: DUF5723 family protein [Paludibacter sp.]|nr:DUF5723 family protein [Paludibacter sp.]
MKQINLKTIIGSIMIALALQATNAQLVAKIGYFMDNAPYKHLLNPALVPVRGYVSYPALGSIDFDLQSNLGLKTFLFPAANAGDPPLTFMHEDVTAEQFLNQLNPENYFKLNQRLSLLSFGFYTGTTFWTFETASRINVGLDIPYDFFAFLKQGMSNGSGNYYEINNLNISLGLLSETSLGSSFLVADNIRVGVKGKLLLGGARAKVAFDQVTIDMKPDKWTVTANGLANLYVPGLEFVTNEEGIVDNFDYSSPNIAGLGVGFDLGASWTPIKNVTVSAGIIDLGKISWNKTFNRVARSNGTVEFSGMEGISLNDNQGEEEDDDTMKEMMENFKKMAQLKPVDESDNYVESLTPTINAGVEAGVLNNKISVGLLYTNKMIPNNNISEITGMLNLKPFSGFNLSASYSLLNGVAETFGVGMGLNLGIVNIFMACDYVPTMYTPQYIPLSKATTHLQVGLTIGLSKMKAKK